MIRGLEHSLCVLRRHGGIYHSDVALKPINPGLARRLPLGGRALVKDATEGARLAHRLR